MIFDASLSFGQVPTATEKAKAISDFQTLKQDLTHLSPNIPLKLGLGNDETYP